MSTIQQQIAEQIAGKTVTKVDTGLKYITPGELEIVKTLLKKIPIKTTSKVILAVESEDPAYSDFIQESLDSDKKTYCKFVECSRVTWQTESNKQYKWSIINRVVI